MLWENQLVIHSLSMFLSIQNLASLIYRVISFALKEDITKFIAVSCQGL